MCSLQERLMIDGGGLMVDALSPRGDTLNQGEWKKLENSWATSINSGKKVDVKIKVIFDGNSKRPSRYEVEYWIDGEEFDPIRFINQ